MAKKVTRTVTSYQTEKNGVVKNNLSMVEAMEEWGLPIWERKK